MVNRNVELLEETVGDVYIEAFLTKNIIPEYTELCKDLGIKESADSAKEKVLMFMKEHQIPVFNVQKVEDFLNKKVYDMFVEVCNILPLDKRERGFLSNFSWGWTVIKSSPFGSNVLKYGGQPNIFWVQQLALIEDRARAKKESSVGMGSFIKSLFNSSSYAPEMVEKSKTEYYLYEPAYTGWINSTMVYEKIIPIEILRNMRILSVKFPDLQFFVTEIGQNQHQDPDPFICCMFEDKSMIIFGQWDEPGFVA